MNAGKRYIMTFISMCKKNILLKNTAQKKINKN